MDKHTNNMLFTGILFLVLGLVLLAYSISSFIETRELTNKIDFTELENNNQMPDSDKYFQYLSNADFLNQKLNQNKNLPFKNASCAYVDYAQRNALDLYKLIENQTESTRKEVAEGNIKSLLTIYENYKTCKNISKYKEELNKILENQQRQNELFEEDRMNRFIDDSYSNVENKSYPNEETNSERQNPSAEYSENSYGTSREQTGGTY